MTDRIEVVIVGAGQAGLAVSRELAQAGLAHVVLERGRVGQTWRGRWESFCLVTPNWFCRLPGHPYDGDDPDGFMARDEVVAYLERYAAGFEAPVRERCEVTSLRPERDGGFRLETSAGEIVARTVVLSTVLSGPPTRRAVARPDVGKLILTVTGPTQTIVGDQWLIVRRTRLVGAQAELRPDLWDFASLANRTEPIDAAWTVIACLAHNLLAWTTVIGLPGSTIRAAHTGGCSRSPAG